MKEFKDRLRLAIERAGLKQAEIVERTGINKGALSSYLTGSYKPKQDNTHKLARVLNVSESWLMGFDVPMTPSNLPLRNEVPMPKGGVKIPVLGKVVAGAPCEAIEDIGECIDISPAQAIFGDHFALQIKGYSMSPKIDDGDIVIVQKNFELEDGDTVILSINGDEATCKKVFKQANGIIVQANNPNEFITRFFTYEQIESLPVIILGKVVEIRRRP